MAAAMQRQPHGGRPYFEVKVALDANAIAGHGQARAAPLHLAPAVLPCLSRDGYVSGGGREGGGGRDREAVVGNMGRVGLGASSLLALPASKRCQPLDVAVCPSLSCPYPYELPS